jgi:hypothetical protein
MTEQFLNDANVSAGLQQVSCKRMSHCCCIVLLRVYPLGRTGCITLTLNSQSF